MSFQTIFAVALIISSSFAAAAQTPQTTPTPVGQAGTPAPQGQGAAASSEDLAKQLQNPVASLISVPFQNNYECSFGSNETCRNTLNIQPVIPFSVSQNWNLITRTIVPVISQGRLFEGDDTDFGLGDITQSFFFSPKRKVSGLILAGGRSFSIRQRRIGISALASGAPGQRLLCSSKRAVTATVCSRITSGRSRGPRAGAM